MNKYELQNNLKKTGSAYLFFLLFGSHYAYMGKWGVQILFWFTLGGMGIWTIIDLLRMPSIVQSYNRPIFDALEQMDRLDKLEAR